MNNQKKGTGKLHSLEESKAHSEASLDELEVRKRSLERELDAFAKKKAKDQAHDKVESSTNVAQAIKLASEFFSAVLVGVVLGFGLDRIAGTSPFGLIAFVILGFAAAVLNVVRSLGYKEQKVPEAEDKAPKSE